LAPGTGKTPTTLVALQEAGPHRVLIVAPKTMVGHWIDLAAVWYPALQVVDGTGNRDLRQCARALVRGKPERPTALVLNYEAMRTDVETLSDIVWGALVADECHRLKNRRALVTKTAKRLTRHPRMWCWLLSGTPIPNRPEEAWSLLNLIDRHRFSSYWNWVEEHCTTEPIYKGRMRVANARTITGLQPGAVERVREQLADVLLYRTLEELLPDLPEVTTTTVTVALDDEERRIYDHLSERYWAELGDGILLQAPNDVARITRLRQMVSDISILRPGEPGTKVRAAAELASDLEPAQVVVLTWSRGAAEGVAGLVGGEFIHGGVSAGERRRILDSFKSGDLRVLAGTLSTLGEGMDGMQVAHHMIRLDRDWTPARNEQAIARIRRSGQRSDAVFCWDITAADTVDAVVERALRHKEDVLTAVLSSGSGYPPGV
jgi:SNF2 family DNA or RNA helicase